MHETMGAYGECIATKGLVYHSVDSTSLTSVPLVAPHHSPVGCASFPMCMKMDSMTPSRSFESAISQSNRIHIQRVDPPALSSPRPASSSSQSHSHREASRPVPSPSHPVARTTGRTASPWVSASRWEPSALGCLSAAFETAPPTDERHHTPRLRTPYSERSSLPLIRSYFRLLEHCCPLHVIQE